MTQTNARHAARMLLVASVGFLLLGLGARYYAPLTTDGVTPPAQPAPTAPREAAAAMFAHGEGDDRPAVACWRIDIVGVPESCLCSVVSVEDFLAPNFMRVLLTSWRDTGHLTTGEWRKSLAQVDAACRAPTIVP